jgi:chromosome segregation ATPase
MRIDDILEQHEAFLDRAQDVLRLEVDRGKKSVAASKAELATTRTALDEVKSELGSAKKDLAEVLSNLGKGRTLAGIDYEIGERRKELAGLESDTTKAKTTLAGLTRECKDAENGLNELNAGMQGVRQERADAIAAIDNARKIANSFEPLRRSA